MAKKVKAKTMYVCNECGYQTVGWFGRCPQCEEWSTCEEMEVVTTSAGVIHPKGEAAVYPITNVEMGEGHRLSLLDSELDLLFGGGVMVGSVILIGGEPGIGKSTFLTQIAAIFGENYGGVVYATGEESLKQVRLRAERIGAINDGFYLMAENDLSKIIDAVHRVKPNLLVVDSIQTMSDSSLDSLPGSVTQIRECTSKLLHLAKQEQITIMIAGHVTKEGVIAGPRILEHMVDVVLYFEGDRHQGFRLLRSVKNRFGSTNEVALLDMTESGLVPFHNPASYFLSKHDDEIGGSAVGAVMEGTRSFLIEVQSLVAKTSFGNPRRVAGGMDYNRLLLIVAVLEKVLGLRLGDQDVYINVTGGLKINDTASDLAVAAAIVSGFRGLPLRKNLLLLGEIGLGGEIRTVGDIDKHIREGRKFGFDTFIVPAYYGSKKQKEREGVITVRSLKQALGHIWEE